MEAVSYLEAQERTLKLVEAIMMGMPIHIIAKKF
jgi:antitoxin (DNA-binding transcriptional repressor) of toxin-antitoxin stability system